MSVRKTCVRHDYRSVNLVQIDKPNMSLVSNAGYPIYAHPVKYDVLIYYFSTSVQHYFLCLPIII